MLTLRRISSLQDRKLFGLCLLSETLATISSASLTSPFQLRRRKTSGRLGRWRSWPEDQEDALPTFLWSWAHCSRSKELLFTTPPWTVMTLSQHSPITWVDSGRKEVSSAGTATSFDTTSTATLGSHHSMSFSCFLCLYVFHRWLWSVTMVPAGPNQEHHQGWSVNLCPKLSQLHSSWTW